MPFAIVYVIVQAEEVFSVYFSRLLVNAGELYTTMYVERTERSVSYKIIFLVHFEPYSK